MSNIGLASYQHLRDLQGHDQAQLDAFNESQYNILGQKMAAIENDPNMSQEQKRQGILGIRQQQFKLMTPKLAKKRLAELQQKYGLNDYGPQTGTVPAEQPLNLGGIELPGKPAQQISRPADINDILASGQPASQGQWIGEEYNQLIKLGYDPEHAKKLIDFRMGYREPNERGNWEILTGTLNGKRVSLQHNRIDGTYTDPNGNTIDAAGFIPDPKASTNPKLGTFGEFLQRVAGANGVTTDDLSPDTVLQLRQAFAAAGTPVRISQGSYQYRDDTTGNIYTVPIQRKSYAAPVPMPQINPASTTAPSGPTSAPPPAPAAPAPAAQQTAPQPTTPGALKGKAQGKTPTPSPAPSTKGQGGQGRMIGHTASLSDKASIKSASKQIDTVTPMINVDQTMADYVRGKNYTPRQDLSLVVAAVRAMNPGTVRLPQKELELEIAAGSWGDRAKRQWDIATTGKLPDDQRIDLQKVVHNETAHSARNAAASWQQTNPNGAIPVILQSYVNEQPQGGDSVVVQVDGKQYRMTRENMDRAISDGHKVIRIQ